jgi:hypothetical protein
MNFDEMRSNWFEGSKVEGSMCFGFQKKLQVPGFFVASGWYRGKRCQLWMTLQVLADTWADGAGWDEKMKADFSR